MKFTIEKHEEHLRNSRLYEQNLAAEIGRMMERLTRLQEDNNFAEWQVNTAKKRGIAEYDSDKLGVSRGSKKLTTN